VVHSYSTLQAANVSPWRATEVPPAARMARGMLLYGWQGLLELFEDYTIIMISVLILVFSVGAVLQFGLSYCRSLLAGFAEYGVSARTRELGALAEGAARGEDFGKLMSLIRVCPHAGNDGRQLLFVQLYFVLLGAIGIIGGRSQDIVQWAARERGNCAQAVAVMLDRRVLASVPSTE
jgi:hypothetical protein